MDKTFESFGKQVEWALKERNITAPVQILKADGGTLPLETALKQPVEAVFTGPAASVLGIEALGAAPEGKCISLDVGGTTTDIAFWDNGEPLLAKKRRNDWQIPDSGAFFPYAQRGHWRRQRYNQTAAWALRLGRNVPGVRQR